MQENQYYRRAASFFFGWGKVLNEIEETGPLYSNKCENTF